MQTHIRKVFSLDRTQVGTAEFSDEGGVVFQATNPQLQAYIDKTMLRESFLVTTQDSHRLATLDDVTPSELESDMCSEGFHLEGGWLDLPDSPSTVHISTPGEEARQQGDRFREGVGVVQDFAKARHWYEVAAKNGDAKAQNNLGTMLLDGLGCEPDAKAAAYWYQMSANQGFEIAQYNLGKRYLHGSGVDKDEQAAFHWIGLAAEQGDLTAMGVLGAMFRIGCGTEPNLGRAALWHIEAAFKNDTDSIDELSSYKEKLAEVALEGDRLAAFALARMNLLGYGCDPAPSAGWGWLRYAHDFCCPITAVEHLKADWLNDFIAAELNSHRQLLDESTRKEGEQLLVEWLSAAKKPIKG